MINQEYKLLTIIIPCYNAEKYLTRCFKSLEELDSKYISILFINDGSIDLTKDIIEKWATKHCNVQIISQQNSGYSMAINKGIDYSRSDYLMFLGVDDEIVPNNLNKICLCLENKRTDIIAFTTQMLYDDLKDLSNNQFDKMTVYKKPGSYSGNISDLYHLLGNDILILFMRDTSRIIKKSVIGNLRYFGRYGISADGCFSSLVAFKSHSFMFVNELCYIWHLHRDSVSGSYKTKEKLIDEAEVWEKYFNELLCMKNLSQLPDPIIEHLALYKRVVKKLYKLSEISLARHHDAIVKKYTQIIICSYIVTLKSLFKLLFFNEYILISDIILYIKIKLKGIISLYRRYLMALK